MNHTTMAKYPQGLSLLALQKEQQQGYHHIQLTLTTDVNVDQLQQIVAAMVANTQCLHARYDQVAGFRGIRQLPLAEPVALSWQQHEQAEKISSRLDAVNAVLVQADLLINDTAASLSLYISCLAMDAISVRQFAEQLAQNVRTTTVVDADDETLDYPEFVEWWQELAADEDAQPGQNYWQRYQQQFQQLPQLQLPYRQTNADLSGDAKLQRLTQTLTADQLASVRRQVSEALPLNALLQATWWTLLARASQRESFRAIYVHDCRDEYEDLAGALGVYAQPLPLQVSLNEGTSITSLVQQLQQSMTQHAEWQESYPFSEDRQALARFQSATALSAELNVQSPLQGAELQLTVVQAANGDVQLELDYLAERFSAAAMQQLLMQYVQLLDQFATQANQAWARLPLLTEQDQQLQAAYLRSPVLSEADSVLARISAHAANSPDQIALVDGDQSLTYQQLQQQVEQLAAALRAQGVKANTAVALQMPRSAQLVIAMLAVMRAGGRYVPLEPSWPEARQQKILQQVNPALTLSSKRLAELQAQSVDVAAVTELPAEEQAAYIIFTSGSTGTPKGVVIGQQQLALYCAGVSEALSLQSCQRFALTSTVAADLGYTALYSALYLGRTLVVASEQDMADGVHFEQFLKSNAIDCIKMVPSHLQALCDDPNAMPQTLVLGGEVADSAFVTRLCQSERRVFNHYGPTEATVGVMFAALGNDNPQGALTDVLPASQVVILDDQQQAVAAGDIGELYIGGGQLATGYFETESDAFVQLAEPYNGRFYRSGDLARYLPDGGVQIIGRRDQQLNVRGFRIEPAEVELALNQQADIRKAVVKVDDKLGLVAYLDMPSSREGILPTEQQQQLTQSLAQQLPDAMIPARYAVLASWPVLANGKVDINQLPDINALLPVPVYVAPRTELEHLLAEQAAQLLELEQVSVSDSFMALGGHSLLVIKLVARIRKLLKLEVAPAVIFENPSVEALARVLGQLGDSTRLEQMATIQRKLATMTPEQQAAIRQQMNAPSAG